MRVYVASSWRNELQPDVVRALREDGHEVYDFRNPSGAEGDCGFAWSEIESRWKDWTAAEYVAALEHPSAVSGFAADMNALRACDACVLVQPCGISAHLEFGWAVGAGRFGVVLVPGIREPELMLKMGDRLCLSLAAVREELRAFTPGARPVTWEATIQDAVEWFWRTIPQGAETVALKAGQEAIEFTDEPSAEEAADVIILCLAFWAHLRREDLLGAIRAKIAKNKRRTWARKPDGTWQHTSEVSA